MCGRAAQSQHVVYAAATSLQVHCTNYEANQVHGGSNSTSSDGGGSCQQQEASTESYDLDLATGTFNDKDPSSLDLKTSPSVARYEWNDNFNMSPGMDAMVFFKDKTSGKVRMDRKVWGLISRRGTKSNPLPTGMNQHFQALMFNARSDSLYEKPTFARLAAMGRSCVIALDGFFEWKESTLKGTKKQPYFVYRRSSKNTTVTTTGNDKTTTTTTPPPPPTYLLMPGLWTRVPTGRVEDPVLDTFTIITTEVCQPIEWLHSRMPVCIWNQNLARAWLDHPTEAIHRQMEAEAKHTGEGMFGWHAVTPAMSVTTFRSNDAIKPLPKFKTVKSFFTVASDTSSKRNKKSTSKSISLSEKEESTKDDKAPLLLSSPSHVHEAPTVYNVDDPISTTTFKTSKRPLLSTTQPTLKKTKLNPTVVNKTKQTIKNKKPENPRNVSITSFFSPKKK